ncbi:MAG: SUMF1/EgtB/PvdO family nonheme iron enzyme [Chitinivibrionales bacterium]|nr:SUMF1/EgtB/PvdO family nonheme iron enzyme [Chitinivibrionales bacterium]
MVSSNFCLSKLKRAVAFLFIAISLNGDPVFAALANLQRPIKMVTIPAGTFTMGGKGGTWGEGTVTAHQVTLSAFALQETEVTQEQYKAVMGVNPSMNTSSVLLPVERVSQVDAARFCNKLSIMEGLDPCYLDTSNANTRWDCDFTKNGFRLPTEAQWEYACRAGTTTTYYGGNDWSTALPPYCWFYINSNNITQPVGGLKANAWGMYDMEGNVYELVYDWYADYTADAQTDPTGPKTGWAIVARGGSAGHDPYYEACAYREYNPPGAADAALARGFRIAAPAQAATNAVAVSPVQITKGLKIAYVKGVMVMTMPSSLIHGLAEISLFDIAGRYVYDHPGLSGVPLRIETGRLAAGVYNALVRLDGKVYSHRFMVAKGQ